MDILEWYAITADIEKSLKPNQKYTVNIRTKSGQPWEGCLCTILPVHGSDSLAVVVLSLSDHPPFYISLTEVESVTLNGSVL